MGSSRRLTTVSSTPPRQLAPILPEPQRTEWQQTLALLSHSILGTFYSPGDNLFFTLANTPQDRDLTFSGVDFGHTSKALWMMRWTGLMLGDQGMVSFAEAAGRRLFGRAYLPEDGSWAEGVLAGGQTDKNKNWWISAELDHLSGWRSATLTLGVTSPTPRIPGSSISWTLSTTKCGTA